MVGQQRAGTLKAFVRVSKNSNGATVDGKRASATRGKQEAPATVSSKRMSTRSQSAKNDTEEIKSAVDTEEKPASVRKRKSGNVVQSQAKRVATKVASAAKSSVAALVTPTKRKATTIGAYFPSSPVATASSRSKDNNPSDNSLGDVSTNSEKQQSELLPISEDTSEKPLTTIVDKEHSDIVQQSTSAEFKEKDTAEDPEMMKKTTLRSKTNALLEKLRNRKRPSSKDDNENDDGGAQPERDSKIATTTVSPAIPLEAAEPNKISVTRAIQERIRERREATNSKGQRQPETTDHDGAKFEAARVKSAADAQMQELKRQFVLIQSRATDTRAPLSSELRKLDELFQGLEHVALFGGQAGSRSAGVVYHKVRKGVESMAKRTFGWKELGQILAIYPDAYSYEPVTTTNEGRRVTSVVLTPLAQGVDLAVGMERRRDEFRRRLVARVADAHARFLVDRGFSVGDIGSAAVAAAGWHPLFDIESTPKVAPIPLPPAPAPRATAAGAISASMKQQPGPVAMFDKNKLKHLLGMRSTNPSNSDTAPDQAASTSNASESAATSRSAAAALGLPTPSDSPVMHPSAMATKDSSSDPPSSATKKIKKSLASGAKGLLERIRAKQRAKEAAVQMASGSAIPLSTRSMHSRLPAVLDAISFLYYSERKSVMSFYYVTEKIGESKSLDRPDAIEHIVALARFVPEWCTIVDNERKTTDGDAAPAPAPASAPSPDARLKIVRALSAKEAKEKLAAKIASLSS
ncbi:hypothetical protein IW140_003123 [Coemansia sp. RSA 1813]|nr:hypothetical protein LPJ74_004733 [Coemansia sp. RSA 1843]KAJ2214537.1 hypothetical protein EV179_002942 [Coemansia sp. RSA 487]KAJ2569420.1 hypothetical protein IW140_003123 [Coemansia sp. RSA 1813]